MSTLPTKDTLMRNDNEYRKKLECLENFNNKGVGDYEE
jgi:hypothetical protein